MPVRKISGLKHNGPAAVLWRSHIRRQARCCDLCSVGYTLLCHIPLLFCLHVSASSFLFLLLTRFRVKFPCSSAYTFPRQVSLFFCLHVSASSFLVLLPICFRVKLPCSSAYTFPRQVSLFFCLYVSALSFLVLLRSTRACRFVQLRCSKTAATGVL